MSTKPPVFKRTQFPKHASIAIVAARFNSEFVDELLKGCLTRLKKLGLPKSCITVHRVPGAFELPVAAQTLARTRRFSAIICLGCVIRGETPHFDYVAGQCAAGIQHLALAESLPVIFGVLTTNNEAQAWDRLGGKHGHAGQRAAEAALEMAALINEIKADDIPF